MIVLKGQYAFKFDLNGETDFINNEDLLKFSIVEKAGGTLPEFELQFLSYDDSLLSKLNETSDFKVSYGRDTNDLKDSSLSIQALESGRAGNDRRHIAIIGFYSALKYLNQTNSFFSEKKSGVEVMKDIVSQHFTPDFNIDSSEDSQVWIQPNQTDRSFIKELWMHSYLSKSFPAIAISSDGKFIMKDIAKTFKDEYLYKFTTNTDSADPKSIPYDGDFSLKVSRGFINSWVGYDRERLAFSFEDGSQSLVKETVEPLLALTEKFARNASVEKRFYSNTVLNQNMHPNYWKAASKNLSHLAQFGDTKITLTFSNFFVPIRCLDLVMFKDDETGKTGQTVDAISGLYLVSGVARNYQDKQYTTVVELTRESMNNIQGANVAETLDSATATESANALASEISSNAELSDAT